MKKVSDLLPIERLSVIHDIHLPPFWLLTNHFSLLTRLARWEQCGTGLSLQWLHSHTPALTECGRKNCHLNSIRGRVYKLFLSSREGGSS